MEDHIKVGDVSPRIQYVGDGMQSTFTYPFPIFEDSNIEVYIGDTLQTATSDYTVSGAGEDNGGSVSFLSAPSASETITLIRNLSVKRETDFQESGEFRAKVINDELDKIIAMLQEVEDQLNRGLFLSNTDAAGSLSLPTQAERANAHLAFDSAGNPIATADPGAYPASTFMGTVLDDPDAATARATLGLAIGIDVLSPTGDGSGLTGIAGGGPSLGTDSVIRTNAQTISEDIAFAGTENGMTAGPITIEPTYTVTVTGGSTWTIVGG